MEKLFIKNRKDQKVSVIIEEDAEQKGLAFVMHGLGGFKEQPHVETFAQAFKDKGFTVIRFDTTNTYGESDGDYSDATTTNYYEDLEDVIEWAKSQEWYEEPFWLSGHSLGGICTAMYAENHPNKVKAVAPISPVVSGKLSKETYDPKELEEWEKTGWKEKPSASLPGVIKRLKFSEFVDRHKYDLLPMADKLTMPVMIIVGEKDERTPPKHQQILFDAIQGDNKELHIIKDAPHTFREKSHLKEIKENFLNWIENNL
jgi:dipeptidyl aminopeptidase/acylaminoacyl peptidase